MAIKTPDNQRVYTRDDVEVLNLVSNPIWVFDITNKSMWWGNTAALEFWSAPTLEDLTRLNCVDDMSEIVNRRNIDTMESLRRNEHVEDYLVSPICFKNSVELWLACRVSQTTPPLLDSLCSFGISWTMNEHFNHVLADSGRIILVAEYPRRHQLRLAEYM